MRNACHFRSYLNGLTFICHLPGRMCVGYTIKYKYVCCVNLMYEADNLYEHKMLDSRYILQAQRFSSSSFVFVGSLPH